MKLMYLSKADTISGIRSEETIEFVDSLLAKGLSNDYFFDQVMFNAKFILNPNKDEMFDHFKQTYIRINPPTLSSKMNEYNELVRSNMKGREDEIINDIMFDKLTGFLYRRLWEDTYIKSPRVSYVNLSNQDWVLNVWFSLGEALSFIHSTVLGQNDVHDKVNKLITSTEAVYNMMNELLLDEDENRRKRFTAVFITTLHIGEFQHNFQYDQRRMDSLRYIVRDPNVILTDIQASNQSIDDIIDCINNNKPLPKQGPMIVTLCVRGIKQLEDVVSKLIYMNYRGIKVSSVARDADELYLTITYDGANDDTIESFFAKKCIYPIYKIFAK